ncbi:amino acid adenylation domain-containing protein [Amycolatopsis panacis]|uniref:Amino acid adenylation domain-containing protein n=2 Tax=Amycolatopsis panacis TaxID=2340917 RepID=A0A419IB72_9PSEU|nr:amino acid adenylation domain-containing protein [Amycolatopsis panacis]
MHHGTRLTYGDLKDLSDALARRLRAVNVRAGDAVGVVGRRSVDALVAFLGILKAGAVYVPLEDTAPPYRLQAMADEAGVHTVVTLPGSVCRLRRVRTRLDVADLDSPRSVADMPAEVEVAATDCAYVMFTSGSTGYPKPVAIPHRGVVRLAFSDLVSQRPRPGDRVLHAYGLSSDASTIEIWAALLNGACLVLIDREELLAPHVLESRLVVERVSIAYLTTGVLHRIARTRPQALRTLRFVSAGGEALDSRLAGAVLAACPDTILVNFYGPTENSVVSTAYQVRELPAGEPTVPIGRPLENSLCCVVSDDGTLAATGEEGELLVGGDGLALGYLGDPDLTAERFPAHAGVPGGRLYRTGDRAIRRADGHLEYRGRTDRQVKLRGHRIELDEVEARLQAHDAVGEAVVDLCDDDLTGYVTPARPGETVPVDQVRQHLAAWLPAAAVPTQLFEVAEFPVTAAGKVDRKRLHDLALPTLPSLSPATPVYQGLTGALATIWQTVLQVCPKPEDEFHALGGDSLLAAEVVTRTLATLGLDAQYGSALIRSLLQTPTLNGFTQAVETVQVHRSAGTPSPVDFAAEGRLGFVLPRPQEPAPSWRRPRAVLVTGTSGFVGAYLLDRFLRTTDAVVYCPVRARDRSHARRRVLANLTRYGLEQPASEDRIVGIPANLNTPGLGMKTGEFDHLADTLDLIVHSAAHVNFLYPYDALSAANVDGTRQIVKLAARRGVPVHFLSTIAVVAGFGTAGIRHVDEDLPLEHPDRLTMGYAESKWVAEKMLQDAAGQGLPIAIYRPYEITGDQRTGACNTETAICSLFKTIAETGLAPTIPLPLDFVPVDYLADAIVHIATTRATTRTTYHLTNPRPAALHHMLDRMRATGHRIHERPYHEWVTELVRYVAQNPTSPTAPFVSLCVDRSNKADISVKEMYFTGTFPELGRVNVDRDLAGSGLHCPPVDAHLLDRYLEFFYSAGYLGRPLANGSLRTGKTL